MPHEGQTGVVFGSGGNKLLASLFLAPGDEPKPTAVLLPVAASSRRPAG